MDVLLTAEDVARILQVTRRHVYVLAEERDPTRRLPAVRLGRLLRFRPEDIERYVEERAS